MPKAFLAGLTLPSFLPLTGPGSPGPSFLLGAEHDQHNAKGPPVGRAFANL